MYTFTGQRASHFIHNHTGCVALQLAAAHWTNWECWHKGVIWYNSIQELVLCEHYTSMKWSSYRTRLWKARRWRHSIRAWSLNTANSITSFSLAWYSQWDVRQLMDRSRPFLQKLPNQKLFHMGITRLVIFPKVMITVMLTKFVSITPSHTRVFW